MSDKISMSLAEIILKNKTMKGGKSYGGIQREQNLKQRGNGVQRGRGRGGIKRRNIPASKLGNVSVGRNYAGKLVISNLNFGVCLHDIFELFAEFGPVDSASLRYDRSGRSLGTAEVIFQRRSYAVRALKEYNGVPLDGRVMNIELVTPEVSMNITNRVSGNKKMRNKTHWRGSRGKTSRGRGGPTNKKQRKQPTAEELDAELDAYAEEIKN